MRTESAPQKMLLHPYRPPQPQALPKLKFSRASRHLCYGKLTRKDSRESQNSFGGICLQRMLPRMQVAWGFWSNQGNLPMEPKLGNEKNNKNNNNKNIRQMTANVGQGGDDSGNFKVSSVKYDTQMQGTRQLYNLMAMILCLHSSLT